jgi:L-fucose mutarotase/ribose pyranase (RbsD/FucU family)
MKPHWEEILKHRLQLYGHRNWLVIADSAYPAQSRHGIETIIADEEQTTVLDRVLAALHKSKHVTATVYIDREMSFVPEEDAPGISSYRQKLDSAFERFEVSSLPHEEIIATLDRIGKTFRVLLIKTNMRIPYTSVFFELGCRYWDGQAEMRLRAAMRPENGRRNGSKRRGVRLLVPADRVRS